MVGVQIGVLPGVGLNRRLRYIEIAGIREIIAQVSHVHADNAVRVSAPEGVELELTADGTLDRIGIGIGGIPSVIPSCVGNGVRAGSGRTVHSRIIGGVGFARHFLAVIGVYIGNRIIDQRFGVEGVLELRISIPAHQAFAVAGKALQSIFVDPLATIYQEARLRPTGGSHAIAR